MDATPANISALPCSSSALCSYTSARPTHRSWTACLPSAAHHPTLLCVPDTLPCRRICRMAMPHLGSPRLTARVDPWLAHARRSCRPSVVSCAHETHADADCLAAAPSVPAACRAHAQSVGSWRRSVSHSRMECTTLIGRPTASMSRLISTKSCL